MNIGKTEDTYGEPETVIYKNIIAKIYTPILTDEERERRMNIIKEAAVHLVLYGKKSPK